MHAEPTKLRSHLEQSLNNVTGKLTKSYKTFEQSNKKIMKENVTLLQHYNDLKQELHSLKCESRVSDDSGSKKRRAEIA